MDLEQKVFLENKVGKEEYVIVVKQGMFKPKILNVQQLMTVICYKGYVLGSMEVTRVRETNLVPAHVHLHSSLSPFRSQIQTHVCYNVTMNCLFLKCRLLLIFHLPESPVLSIKVPSAYKKQDVLLLCHCLEKNTDMESIDSMVFWFSLTFLTFLNINQKYYTKTLF